MIPEWNSFINADCMEYLRQMPDKCVDLAIVDPPYGGGFTEGGGCQGWFAKYHQIDAEQNRTEQNRTEQNRYLNTRHIASGIHKGSKRYEQLLAENREHKKKIISWDIAPDKEYFEQLFRISRNQIIWGGNYFELPPTRCFIVWKKTNIPLEFTMSMCEYAWTSFNSNAKVFEYSSLRTNTSGGFHPTEKPIALYEWLLDNYAQPTDTIIDTHVGSASSLIACRKTGHKYIGFEVDKDYYRKASARLEKESAQVNIFDLLQPKAEQITMFGESEDT